MTGCQQSGGRVPALCNTAEADIVVLRCKQNTMRVKANCIKTFKRCFVICFQNTDIGIYIQTANGTECDILHFHCIEGAFRIGFQILRFLTECGIFTGFYTGVVGIYGPGKDSRSGVFIFVPPCQQ